MKTESSTSLQRVLFTALVACLLSSCAMPTRDAWRIVQKDGLFNYWAGNYGTGYSTGGYASASPFQTSQPYAAPRPTNQVPYRTTYHSNRYRVADYNRVPYRPKTVASSHSQRKTTSSRPKNYNEPRAHSSNSSPSSSRELATKDEVKSQPTPAPQTASSSSVPVTQPVETLPYGAAVTGRPGMVTSPYAQKQQLVDVTGLAPGDTVKDPYSGKLFKVPPTQQAAAPSKPSVEAPASPVKTSPANTTPTAPTAPSPTAAPDTSKP